MAKDVQSMFTYMKSDLQWKSWNEKYLKNWKFDHFEFQLWLQRSPWKCKHTFNILGHLVKKLSSNRNIQGKVQGGLFFIDFSIIPNKCR